VTAQGFKTNVLRDIVVNVDQTVHLDMTLDLGEVDTRVEVAAATPVVLRLRSLYGWSSLFPGLRLRAGFRCYWTERR
jgi:hypothetical protein